MDRDIKKYNSLKARYRLGFLDSKATAKNINYIGVIIKFLSLSALLLFISDILFIAINHLVYLVQNILKLILFTITHIGGYKGITSSFTRHCKEHSEEAIHKVGYRLTRLRLSAPINYLHLPIYSILIPMYKEGWGVKTILHHLSKLEYPVNKLEIKLVVEDDDLDTINVIDSLKIPKHIDVIKVPYSEPRTKPKAMNYAMEYIKGEYVVIYDVEDRPEPDQLIKAVDAFSTFPDYVVCLQGKLRFYNHDTNLLTKLFNIEYQIWFDFLLPAIDKSDLPVPLGGNSNHFKVEPLKRLGLWDAYNVTEDADLGIRLFMHGYKTKIIDSYTFEEATTEITNWINQRSRWIKGFIQTFFVYFGQSSNLKARMSLKSRICVYIFIGFTTYGFLLLPWYLIIPQSNNFTNSLLSKPNLYMTFLYMYYSAVIVATSKKLRLLDIAALIIWPFYFILHIIAAYKGIFELVTKPFSWNKTKHEISNDKTTSDH